jgi:C4-type Zn-finger protein
MPEEKFPELEEVGYIPTCPKCGGELKLVKYDYSPIGGKVAFLICLNVNCPYIKIISVEGKIPEELARKIYPGYTEVF